jgi:hypothetical protein
MIPKVGRIVHYVLPTGGRKGEHRPAIIIRLNEDQTTRLHVFVDNEDGAVFKAVPYLTNAFEGTPDVEGAWHWPERD